MLRTALGCTLSIPVLVGPATWLVASGNPVLGAPLIAAAGVCSVVAARLMPERGMGFADFERAFRSYAATQHEARPPR